MGAGGALDAGPGFLLCVAVVCGGERAHDVVEGGFEVEDAVSSAGDPRTSFAAEVVDGRGWGGGGVALGFFFEEGDVVDADREERTETRGFIRE